jgi:UDP-N-acetylglucosamine acyltransferase
MADVHATAIIDPAADLAADVRIGPYCVVGADVTLAAGVVLHSHVVVEGRTQVGAGCEIYPFASIGHRPQDLKYRGEPSRLVIGAGNVIREHATMNPGTEGGGMVTRVGDGCLFMMGSHVAHDCRIGDGVVMANNATLGGHVHVEDHAVIGGLAAVHQFVRVGRCAMVGGMSGVEQDVIPYGMAIGDRARLTGLNIVGMKRRGCEREEIRTLRAAYQALFGSHDTLQERLQRVEEEYGWAGPVQDLVAFVRADSSRALCQPRNGNGG